MKTKNYAPKLPLLIDSNDNFVNINDALTNAKQRLKMIILTNPGEKIMMPDFGVGIRKYLFENAGTLVTQNSENNRITSYSAEDILEKIRESIINQVQKYASDITINNIETFFLDDLTISLKINYNYQRIGGSLDVIVGI